MVLNRPTTGAVRVRPPNTDHHGSGLRSHGEGPGCHAGAILTVRRSVSRYAAHTLISDEEAHGRVLAFNFFDQHFAARPFSRRGVRLTGNVPRLTPHGTPPSHHVGPHP
jgi:hypothetical protein